MDLGKVDAPILDENQIKLLEEYVVAGIVSTKKAEEIKQGSLFNVLSCGHLEERTRIWEEWRSAIESTHKIQWAFHLNVKSIISRRVANFAKKGPQKSIL